MRPAYAKYEINKVILMNKKLLCALTAVCMAALALAGCSTSGTDPNMIVNVETLTSVPVPGHDTYAPYSNQTLPPGTTLPPFDVSPSPFATPTPTPTPAYSPLPTPRSSDLPSGAPVTNPPSAPPVVTRPPSVTFAPGMAPDQSVFDNCVFLGNSIFEGLHLYGVITHGKFYTKVGLNLNSVYKPSDGSKPLINELNTGSYSGVILMFGQNELGWPNQTAFIEKYENLCKDIKSRQPNAQIFMTGIPPITKKASDKPDNGLSNTTINLYNSQLAELALKLDYCHFINVPSELYGPDGSLPESASGDGVHLNMTYSRIWADNICLTVMSVLWS